MGDRGRALADALSLIDQSIERLMPERGIPGLALAITDRDGLLAHRNYGYADLAALNPVDNETLFQFGSIGKSFTAICLLQLAEEGAIDLDAPVTNYLPWFAVRSPYAPITIHHLLTHTAGIIGGSDFPLDPRFEVWALRDTDAAPPGERCRYSNVGYKALGLLLEAMTDKPYADIVQERIYAPLGMTDSASVIIHDLRRRLAVGHVPFYDDRPWRPAHGMAPATWLETNTGDGCLSATATDLALYLRMLLNEGVCPSGRLLSPASFARMRAPHTEISPGIPYGYGLVDVQEDGRHLIGHGGGMVGYVSSMLGDVDARIGVVALINGMVDAEVIADFALRAVVDARAGEALPELPPVAPAIDAAEFAGIYRGATADLAVEVEADQLILVSERGRIPLEPMRSPAIPDAFIASHPDLALFPLRFGRDGSGSVTELAQGGDWYATDHYEGTRVFETPPEWAVYTGHYRAWNPWDSNFRIIIRKGALLQVSPSGQEETLHPDGAGFRVGDDPHSPERITFDTVVDGEALRARQAGGADYYRFFTP
jgi:CubicO group peptidase (beta-lactamase class C family)